MTKGRYFEMFQNFLNTFSIVLPLIALHSPEAKLQNLCMLTHAVCAFTSADECVPCMCVTIVKVDRVVQFCFSPTTKSSLLCC